MFSVLQRAMEHRKYCDIEIAGVIFIALNMLRLGSVAYENAEGRNSDQCTEIVEKVMSVMI